MLETQENCDLQTRKELVSRVLSSSVICKSARLRDLFLYLCNRVLDDSIEDIHELELGYKVFGRPEHYDTAADNIVRVHASLLRKRLAEYFQTEGISEPLIIEIPKGNYAPIFRKRDLLPAAPGLPDQSGNIVLQPHSTILENTESSVQLLPPPSSTERRPGRPWITWALGLLALAFATLFVFQLIRSRNQPYGSNKSLANAPTVRQFWSGIFRPDAPTQIVLDDASVDLYQEATGHPVALAEYFDRSYFHPLEEAAAAAHLDPKLAHSFLLRRQSNFADVNLTSRLSQNAEALGGSATLQFARDFSFRQMKSGNVILLGTRQSNPWIQSFDSYLTLRWKFDPALDGYYPVDSAAKPAEADKFRSNTDVGKTREGYAGVAFLPNLGGSGNVLIISGSGGAAVGAAMEFLNDDASMSQLRSSLASKKQDAFPYFETLLKVEKGGSLPRNVAIVLSRSPQPATH